MYCSWRVEHEEKIIETTAADAYAASQDGDVEDDSESGLYSDGTSNAHEDVGYVSLSKLPDTMATDVDYSRTWGRVRQAEHRCRATDSAKQTWRVSTSLQVVGAPDLLVA